MTINGKDAFSTWKAYPLSGYVAALMSPASVKPMITSESRLQNGKKVIRVDSDGNSLVKTADRNVTLSIAISESTPALLNTRLQSLIAELMKNRTELTVAKLPGIVFRLDYNGCTQFSQADGLGKFAIKFNEPNPKDRSAS